jgi:hypothetical protein
VIIPRRSLCASPRSSLSLAIGILKGKPRSINDSRTTCPIITPALTPATRSIILFLPPPSSQISTDITFLRVPRKRSTFRRSSCSRTVGRQSIRMLLIQMIGMSECRSCYHIYFLLHLNLGKSVPLSSCVSTLQAGCIILSTFETSFNNRALSQRIHPSGQTSGYPSG